MTTGLNKSTTGYLACSESEKEEYKLRLTKLILMATESYGITLSDSTVVYWCQIIIQQFNQPYEVVRAAFMKGMAGNYGDKYRLLLSDVCKWIKINVEDQDDYKLSDELEEKYQNWNKWIDENTRNIRVDVDFKKMKRVEFEKCFVNLFVKEKDSFSTIMIRKYSENSELFMSQTIIFVKELDSDKFALQSERRMYDYLERKFLDKFKGKY